MGGGTAALEGRIESGSYIRITADCLRAAGVDVKEQNGVFTVSGAYSAPEHTAVEGDWSNAAFWLCAGVMGEKTVSVAGLGADSVQGDRRIVDIISDFGGQIRREGDIFTACPSELHGCEVNAEDVPDLVPVTAVLAACARGETRIYNAGRLRLKESDRLAAVTSVLRTLGADAAERADGLVIRGGTLTGGEVPSWNDHRIAMSAAVAALRAEAPVTIDGAECVKKSYPGFFSDFSMLGGTIEKGA
jgi:3-phosphoshikimate 1-carboxyvinyltransferase